VTEEGDAGSLISDAQTANTSNTETPNSISGNLSENSDTDLYQIYLPEGTTITPSTVGGSEVDTQLFLFNQNGLGISSNDDSQDTSQSTLPVVTQAGTYYVGISSYENMPLSMEGVIFGEGAGANSPLSGWDNAGSDSGSYTISLRSPSTSNLAISPGKTLALIGGNVRFEGGKLISPGSNVYLGSVKANGVVSLVGGMQPVLPNNLARGDIKMINNALIDVSSSGDFDGGNITLVGNNITTGNLLSFSHENSRNGGVIAITARGDISTRNISSDGGAITFTAGRDISTQYISSDISSVLNPGNGGAITFTAGGDISTQNNIDSGSYLGNGGAITLMAGGDISTRNISSDSFSDSGNGGAITLMAGGNISTRNISSASYLGNGGTITLTAGGDISTEYISSDGEAITLWS
jgi:hypothetical protein